MRITMEMTDGRAVEVGDGRHRCDLVHCHLGGFAQSRCSAAHLTTTLRKEMSCRTYRSTRS